MLLQGEQLRRSALGEAYSVGPQQDSAERASALSNPGARRQSDFGPGPGCPSPRRNLRGRGVGTRATAQAYLRGRIVSAGPGPPRTCVSCTSG
jgi:hypothetical protein